MGSKFKEAQVCTYPLAEVAQGSLKKGNVPRILTKGGLPADGLGRSGRLHFALIDASGMALHKLAPDAEISLQHTHRRFSQLPDGLNAKTL